VAYSQADLDALKTAQKSGVRSIRLPNGQAISMQDRAHVAWLIGQMKRDIRGSQAPSVHRTIFDRGL
jgi:hypothetical protein